MDKTDRLNLQKMINANQTEDFTDDIRQKQHSEPIKKDLQTMLSLKKMYSDIV